MLPKLWGGSASATIPNKFFKVHERIATKPMRHVSRRATLKSHFSCGDTFEVLSSVRMETFLLALAVSIGIA